MADTTFVIDTLATGGATKTVTDDGSGSGSDWLSITGTHSGTSTITLAWTSVSGTATQASGLYTDGTVSSRLIVNGAIENVLGSNGKDDITGNELANILYGDQAATGSGNADTISGAAGNDTVYGGAGADLIYGSYDNDLLFGDAAADQINGDAGIDTVEGGAGADSLSGGADIGDTLSCLASTAGVKVNITFGTTTTVTGGDGQGDSINSFSDVWGSAFADTITDTNTGTLSGGLNNNLFKGGDGNDVLTLGGGSDTAYGGAGNDKLYGGGKATP